MRAFRITKTRYLDGLDCEGARLYGGRFNSVGTPLLYLASSEALAILEARVRSRSPMPPDRRFHEIEVPSAAVTSIADPGLVLPVDWDARPETASSQMFGDAWVRSVASLALRVPSAVSPRDFNILVNPAHSRFKEVRRIGSRIENLDRRLW